MREGCSEAAALGLLLVVVVARSGRGCMQFFFFSFAFLFFDEEVGGDLKKEKNSKNLEQSFASDPSRTILPARHGRLPLRAGHKDRYLGQRRAVRAAKERWTRAGIEHEREHSTFRRSLLPCPSSTSTSSLSLEKKIYQKLNISTVASP